MSKEREMTASAANDDGTPQTTSGEANAVEIPQPAKKESKPVAVPESVYSADELAKAAASVFGTTPDIVRTALRMEGVTEATVSSAKSIVRKFKKREVQ